MDVFAYAMKREKDSEAYYRRLADGCRPKGMKRILNRLADAEVRHYEVVERMREGALVSAADDGFLAGMKADFAEFRDRGKALLDEMSQLDLYRKAQGFEKESMELYIEKAEETEDPAMRRVLVSLASQEKMHYNILDTIIILVSRPELGNWLEDAEWFHLEQY